jgi:RHS repeat-associated protein
MGQSCPPALSNDSFWGISESDQMCWSGGTVVQNGQIVEQKRKQSWTTCDGHDAGSVKYLKHRRLVCPVYYGSRTKPDGSLQCVIPYCATCDSYSGANLVEGSNKQTESDYDSSDGLAFSRIYNSGARSRTPGTGPFVSGPSDVWRRSYSRSLEIISGYSNLSARLTNDDGSSLYLNGSGEEIHNVNGAATRLASWGGSGWKVTRPNSDVEYYDSTGKLTSVVTRAGLATNLGYDGSGRLSTITNSFGRALTLGYTNSALTSLTLPGGGQITYAYDDKGRPTTVTYPDATSRTYHYEDINNQLLLTGVTDQNGTRYSTFTYTDNGILLSKEKAGGVERFTFTAANPAAPQANSQITDPLGRTRSYVTQRKHGVFRLQASTTYCPSCPNVGGADFDANGNYSYKTDLTGKRTNYTFDLTRNLETSRTEGLALNGDATSSSRTITTGWHPTFRLPTLVKVYAGATATGTPLQTTTMTYDIVGNLLTRTIADPAASLSRTWVYTYDSFGHVLTEDGPRTDVGDVTTYTYYTCASGGECGQLHTVTNALSQVVTYNTYNAQAQPTLITDANGVQTSLTYDVMRRLISRTTAYGTASAETTAFEYWPTGQLKKVTGPDNSFLLYTYDGAHRLIKVEDGGGNRLEYVLDAVGNRQSTNAYDPFGTLVKVQHVLYNNLGQLWQQLTAAGTDTEATVFGYDASGNQTSVTAPLNRVSTNTYDEINRLKQTIDPAGGVTSIAYDALDNLAQVNDPRGLVTSYVSNGLGDLKQLTSPDTGVTTFTYDSGANVLTSTDARGAVATNTFDSLNRVLTTTYSVGSTTDQSLTFTYDTGANGKGRMTAASDANHTLTWTYDANGRVTGKTQAIGGIAKSVSYAYTGGNLTSMITPSGQTIAYAHDALGRVSGVTINGATLISNVAYDPFGPITGWTWGNGTLTVRNFDLDGRLDLIDSAGLSTFTFDAAGNLASKLDDSPASYALAAGSTTISNSATSNRIGTTTGLLVRSYSYDAAGNTTSDGTRTFAYNFANRMISATKGSVTASYTHNALGQRIRKQVGAVSTYFFYDEAGHVVGEYDGAGALKEEIVWLGDTPIAIVRPNGASVSTFYIHVDRLNTPRRVTRPSDNVIVWRWNSDPYGEAAADENPDGDAETFSFNLRFPGQYFDGETGLNYNYFRDYDPAVGRYVESDPIGLRGGINTYAYASENPMSRIDRLGLWDWPSLPQGVVNGVTGFGDGAYRAVTLGFGNLQDVRDLFGIDGGVDSCSSTYRYSSFAGNVVGAGALGGAVGARLLRAASKGGRAIYEADGFVQAEGSPFKFDAAYYDDLWNSGRPAPFLAAQEILETATSITADSLKGFYSYSNGVLRMVFNPTTGHVWHLGW